MSGKIAAALERSEARKRAKESAESDTRRFKTHDEFTVDEELAFDKDGTIPEVDDAEVERARAAGWDLLNRDDKGRPRPVEDVEEEEKKTKAREKELAEAEAKSVQDWMEELYPDRDGGLT